MRVLIVEDELKMATLIRRGLMAEGLAADVAVRGEDALWMAGATEYDAIVLDVQLPGIDGFETCRRLREEGVRTPVLMLTARGAVRDRVAGLDDELEGTIEADLRVRARDVAALVSESRRAGTPVTVDGTAGRLVQVLDLRNRAIAGSQGLGDRSVLSNAELRAARERELLLERGAGDGVLLLARRVGRQDVVVVGASLRSRAEARDALLTALLVAGPAVLVLAVLAGYGVAFFALRPVEAMRRRAAALTAADADGRLPVPLPGTSSQRSAKR